jgi:hypothetical protein
MNNHVAFLINSLAGGGAEKVAIRLSEHLPVSAFILLERDVKYKTDKPIFFLSNHSTKTSPIIKTLSIPTYAYKLSKFLETTSPVVSFLERANFVNIISKLFKKHRSHNIRAYGPANRSCWFKKTEQAFSKNSLSERQI